VIVENDELELVAVFVGVGDMSDVAEALYVDAALAEVVDDADLTAEALIDVVPVTG
jgi:hypothetical protein